MSDYISDNVITLFAKELWNRNLDPNNDDDWPWEGYANSWQEKQRGYARGYIKDLNIKFLKRWIEKGIHSDELIAKTILLAFDVRRYKQKQKQLIEQITDPTLRKSVIESLKDDL